MLVSVPNLLENFPKRLNWFPPIAAPATEVSLAKAKEFLKRDLEKCSKIKFENVLNTKGWQSGSL